MPVGAIVFGGVAPDLSAHRAGRAAQPGGYRSLAKPHLQQLRYQVSFFSGELFVLLHGVAPLLAGIRGSITLPSTRLPISCGVALTL